VNFVQRLSRIAVCIAALLTCLGTLGCKHVGFDRGTSPVRPSVVPGASNRFMLNFTVLNPTDNNYAAGTFRVDAKANYSTKFKPLCTKTHSWNVPYMAAKTGKFVVQDFAFDPDAFAGEGCRCLKGQCSGGLLITLKWNSGADAGKKVKGGNTNLNIKWKESGDPAEIVISG